MGQAVGQFRYTAPTGPPGLLPVRLTPAACLHGVRRTWTGPAWSPAQSISSVLISIQSLMTENPYHNEPGFEQVRWLPGQGLRGTFLSACRQVWCWACTVRWGCCFVPRWRCALQCSGRYYPTASLLEGGGPSREPKSPGPICRGARSWLTLGHRENSSDHKAVSWYTPVLTVLWEAEAGRA